MGKFKDMFEGKRIGQAVMNKDKFVKWYGKKDTLADEKSMMLNLFIITLDTRMMKYIDLV